MLGNISIWQLLIIFAIIVLLFGTKKLRSLGSDLGSAVKGFRNSIKDTPTDEQNAEQAKPVQLNQQTNADVNVSQKTPEQTTQHSDKN